MMNSFVVDNSVVISWCFKDETNQKADGRGERYQCYNCYSRMREPREIGRDGWI